MKLLIIGSRKIEKFDFSKNIPQSVSLIISGGAKGVDTLAEKYADENNIPKKIVLPQYEKYGRAAPLRRNEYMVDMCDCVLAIWDGKSKGSEYAIKYAKKHNKQITVILCDDTN